MPGPLRLRYRNKLFEPLDGFEALFRESLNKCTNLA